MSFERMRGLLLNQAIHGRLVSQEADDGAVKQIGMAPDAEPFTLPKSWRWINIKELVIPTKQTIPVENFTYIDVSSIKNFHLEGVKKLEPSNAPSRARKVVQAGMVLFATVRPYLKNICIAPTLSGNVIASTAFATMSCSDCLINRYLFYVLRSDYFTELVKGKQRGISYPAISERDFYACHIPVPPVKEQIRIVAKLEEAFAEINRAEKAYEELQTLAGVLRGQILQEAIQGKLVPQLESEPEVEQISETPEDVPFTIPLKWKWATIGDSLQYGSSEQVNGQSIPRNAWVLDLEDIEKESGRLLIKKRNISNRSNKAKFKKGDVLYGKLRPYLNKCIIADEAGFSTTEIVAIRPKEGNYKFDAEYLKAFLMSPFFVNYANQASYGVKMPRLGTKDAKAAFIPVPPLAEQCRIVARLNKLLASINQLGD